MCLFGKKYVGLDIADSSVEVAQLKGSFGRGKVISFGRMELEKGIVEKGLIKDQGKLAEAIKKALASAKPKAIKTKEVFFGLAESQTFIHHAFLPPHNRKERQNLIDKELSENIPIELNNLVYSYRILSEEKDKVEILIVASKKTVVSDWLKFFKKIQLEVVNLDVELLATFRNLFTNLPKEPVMVMDIGASTIFVGIFDESGLHYEYVINIAGNNFTQVIAKANDWDFSKAEAEKIKSGLKGRNKKVSEALAKELTKIINEVKESLVDYQNNFGKSVSQIFLVGGSSLLPGLPEYFAKALALEVHIGKTKSMNEKVPLFYIEAVGLALRGIEKHWDKTNPNIPKIISN